MRSSLALQRALATLDAPMASAANVKRRCPELALELELQEPPAALDGWDRRAMAGHGLLRCNQGGALSNKTYATHHANSLPTQRGSQRPDRFFRSVAVAQGNAECMPQRSQQLATSSPRDPDDAVSARAAASSQLDMVREGLPPLPPLPPSARGDRVPAETCSGMPAPSGLLPTGIGWVLLGTRPGCDDINNKQDTSDTS
ncbi:hypothetical protein CFE70_001829 [Pyrenophora teres f. teres 0-1]